MELLTEEAAAKLLKMSKDTLRKLRKSGNGPKYAVIAERILYKVDDLSEWFDRQKGE